MSGQQTRIIELQRQLRIAREALQRIAYVTRNPQAVANEALDKIWPLDQKQPLQNIVGHGRAQG